MESCVALWLKLLCAAVLMPAVIRANTQIANAGTVTIEAMCSSYSAGLKWTVNETRRDAYIVSVVDFRCAKINGVLSSRSDEVNDDRCFKKDGTAFIIPQLVEPFKTHIIGTELEPGTVCTFTAITTDFGNRIMALSAGCAVEDSNPPLPANCTVLSDTQQCQCSCNPGFTESTGLNSFFECVETPTNTTTTMQISTTPTQSVMGSVASTEDPPATQNSTTPTPTLGPSYQVANSSTVTIEAMCSSNSAGLKWTVPDESAYTISVGFRCASYLGYYNQDEFSDDRCFKKDGTVFIIPQLMEPFKTHIIGTELEPGTVCIFNAISRDFGDKIMDTLSASCVVGDSATSLPIQCNDTQGCQCSCSPGFIKRAHADELLECEAIATSPMENATTPPTETDTTLSSETATTPPMETDTTLSSETDTTQPMETDTTLSSETDTTQPMETDTTQPMETDTTQPMETDTTPPMETDATPPMETATMPPMETDTTPPMETDATSPMETDTTQPDIMLLIVSMVSVAVLLVSTVCGLLAICTGTAVYRNYRLKQQHKRMAMPFSSMKLEKIDPNFNPVKIDGTTLFKSGSMLSVFHNLNSFSEERKMRAEENYYFDVSTLSEAVLTTKLENHATKSDSWSIGQGVTDPAAGYENLTNSDSDDVTDLAKSTRKKVVTDSLISYQTQTQETYESASESSPADYVLPTTEVCLDFPKDEVFF